MIRHDYKCIQDDIGEMVRNFLPCLFYYPANLIQYHLPIPTVPDWDDMGLPLFIDSGHPGKAGCLQEGVDEVFFSSDK